MAKSTKLQIGGWKLVFMLLITWLTPFSGLGNLIFCWRDRHYRHRAIIALAVAVGVGLIPHPVMGGVFGWVFRAAWVGMSVWMTFDALAVYKLCRGQRSAASGSAAATATKTKKKKTKKSAR